MPPKTSWNDNFYGNIVETVPINVVSLFQCYFTLKLIFLNNVPCNIALTEQSDVAITVAVE